MFHNQIKIDRQNITVTLVDWKNWVYNTHYADKLCGRLRFYESSYSCSLVEAIEWLRKKKLKKI